MVAAILHLAVIIGGPDWYRFFGAGEDMARAAEGGLWMPALLTTGIASILAIWSAYAFSGAGRIARLPLLRTGLVLISAIYMVRGLVIIPLHLWKPEATDSFSIWSSLIVLVYGIAYTAGTWLAWPALRPIRTA